MSTQEHEIESLLSGLSKEEKLELMNLLSVRDEDRTYNKILHFEPYGWQREFINASKDNKQLLAMTGNRCGKTYTGAHITACHLTGIYPDGWEGHRFDKPINAWAAGISTITTRDILQSELLGNCADPALFGTGALPKDCIIDTVNKVGIPNAVEAVRVKHVSGGTSLLTFKSYEMSQDKFMGTAIDFIWLDEECPEDIFTQCITRTATTSGITILTFTPEHGLTPLVNKFMNDIKPGQFLIQATWEDAPHLDEATKEQLLSVYSPMEREMRSKGVPSLGSGVVFPIADETLLVEPFKIPDHWLKIIGIDLGFDHPNAIACVAKDPDSGNVYLYDEYSERKETIAMHAAAIRARGGNRLPVILPHDGFKHDSAGSGKLIVNLYKDQGINCLPECFSNPPTEAGKKGNQSREYGLHYILTLMQNGQFKVFNTCYRFLQEKAIYHRKDGKIVDLNDDIISATRYAVLSIDRYGRKGSAAMDNYYWNDEYDLKPDWLGGIV